MSGKKTGIVSLTPEQNEALHEDLMRRLFILDDQPSQNEALHQSFLEMVNRTREQNDLRENYFIDTVSNFNQQLAEMETQTSQKIIQSRERVEDLLLNQNEQVTGDILGYIDEQMGQFNDQVLVTHRQQQNQLLRLRRHMLTQRQNDLDKAAIAEEWLKNANQLLTFIDDNYHHQKFAPSKLDSLDEDLRLAVQNFDMGLYDAALVTGQNIYRQASDLRVGLQRDEDQWNTCYMLAGQKIDTIIDELITKQKLEYKPEISEKSFEFDVNYWSNNQWNDLLHKTQNLKTQLENNSGLLSIDDLRKWLTRDLTEIEDQLGQIKKEAIDNLVNSQIRTNIADLVMQALQSQGYALDQGQFFEQDSRNGFGFTARTVSGNAVKVFVNSGPDQKNEIQLEAIDQSPQTEHFMNRRAYEISQALLKFGLNVDQLIQKNQTTYQPSSIGSFAVAEQKSRYVSH